ncbi:MAG: phytanoyl-CoA dioxygenase family protein [Verrucomicrobia bacterium]|nr:phytanoyl-CoA dioxygenase family protein [Verrucomicrobiota bacterium]
MTTKTVASEYARLGYAIIKDGLPEEIMQRAVSELAADIQDRCVEQGMRMERLYEPHANAKNWKFWLELCRHPQALEKVSQQMQCEELVLLMSHLIVKPPYDGMRVHWHQDNTYWKSVVGTDVCTVWLAIDDVDKENGCMYVIPTTHASHEEMEMIPTTGEDDLLKVTLNVTEETAAKAVACILRSGQFSIHDSFIIHGSAPNTSPRRRAGYTMRYGNPATVKVDLNAHWVPVYYVRGSGENLKEGMIDLRAGRALPESPKVKS